MVDEVIVVIPIYKAELSKTERLSLERVCYTLGGYPICLVMPQKLYGLYKTKALIIECFDDSVFDSVYAYSKLLLSQEFYQRFSQYEYMLIYQLDAFVFCDKLQYFCSLGYDYIGAPMPRYKWRKIGGLVGNGGLSLRRITSSIQVIKHIREIRKLDGYDAEFEKLEDEFFGFCGASKDIEFKVPNVKTALEFAIEWDVAHCYRKLSEDHLPFGCHGWSKSRYFDLWQTFIEKTIGYSIEPLSREIFANSRELYADVVRSCINDYLLGRIQRIVPNAKALRCMEDYLPGKRQYILWGNGIVGKRAKKLLSFLQRDICRIFDNGVQVPLEQDGILVTKVDEALLLSRSYVVIISSTRYEGNMQCYLKGIDLEWQKDFFLFREIRDELVKRYYAGVVARYGMGCPMHNYK